MGFLKQKPKFYSLNKILEQNAQYNIIIGERSNGKTYSCLKYALEQYVANGGQLGLVRRWADDFKGKRGQQMFDGLVANGEIEKITNGQWTDVYYYSSRWFFSKWDELGKRVTAPEPFAYAFSVGAMEHDKSTSYPNIRTIIFDEFLTRGMYLPDEFVLFMNVISTIVRYRTDVKIFMLGNTVNKYCPYFKEMGLEHIEQMQQGTIDLYKYGESDLRVAVEYCEQANKQGKPSDVYFAFNNAKLSMITGGVWEMDLYPHCPVKYVPKEILFTYFIVFNNDILQCEIVQHDDLLFTFIHRKTTPLKNENDDLIYSLDYKPRTNWRRNLIKPSLGIEHKIVWFFKNDKVFYQDNEVGEIVRNYIMTCKSMK